MRALILLLLSLLATSCAYQSPGVTDDAGILPRSEIGAAIAVARRRLDSMGLFIPIDTVDVLSANKVKVLYHGDSEWLLLQRVGKQWHIIGYSPAAPSTGIIVTGVFHRSDLTRRSSQPLTYVQLHFR